MRQKNTNPRGLRLTISNHEPMYPVKVEDKLQYIYPTYVDGRASFFSLNVLYIMKLFRRTLEAVVPRDELVETAEKMRQCVGYGELLKLGFKITKKETITAPMVEHPNEGLKFPEKYLYNRDEPGYLIVANWPESEDGEHLFPIMDYIKEHGHPPQEVQYALPS